MGRVSGWQRQALLEWQEEMGLYTQGELKAGAREHLRLLLERTLETEITRQLGARRYARDEARRDWRNGHRRRDLTTELGLLSGLRVPRSRKGSYQPQILARYQRRDQGVNAVILEAFVAGVATRRVGEVLETLLGEKPSASTVSRIAKELDAKAWEFHQRLLEDRWRFLVVDGVHMQVKGAAGLRSRVVLVAYGMEPGGKRELLDFRLAENESEGEWAAFLHSLYQRGLHGKQLRLVISDGAPGIKAALQLVYPYAKQQRCWVHKLRNLLNQVRKRDQEQVKRGAQAIYLARTRREAIQAFRRWKQGWQRVYPKAVACLEKDLDPLLCCFDYPQSLRSKIRTTNAIERAFREVRRRTRPISAFTNDASCERITYALVAHLNAQWSRNPRKPSAKSTHFS
jgi:putative transposase